MSIVEPTAGMIEIGRSLGIFWSYVFAWDIEKEGAITATELEVDLQKYFSKDKWLFQPLQINYSIKVCSGFLGMYACTPRPFRFRAGTRSS